MQQTLAERIISALGWTPSVWINITLILVIAVVVLVFVAVFAGVTSWLERRIAGRMQARIGPNRVGPEGFLQWLADGVKNFLKEDVIPRSVDEPLFRIAPYIVFMGLFGAFTVLPFGVFIIPADLNIGILYLMAVTTLVVVGLLMAGWASNNKWSLLGGVRSTAQIVSYEIPTGLSVLTVVVLSGTLSMEGIIMKQGPWPWEWNIFANPFTFVAFFIYFTSALAEGNRIPFDLPEAESELVSGYNTEYSGMRFLFFLFAEWANLWVIGAVATILFFGGWQVPFAPVTPESGTAGIWVILASIVIFFAKTSIGVFIVIWLRWTLPRFRVDQLMIMCWKYLVPIGFACLLGTLIWGIIPKEAGFGKIFDLGVRLLMTIVGFGVLFLLLRRAWWNISRAKEEPYFKLRV